MIRKIVLKILKAIYWFVGLIMGLSIFTGGLTLLILFFGMLGFGTAGSSDEQIMEVLEMYAGVFIISCLVLLVGFVLKVIIYLIFKLFPEMWTIELNRNGRPQGYFNPKTGMVSQKKILKF